jgi:hypothetical protein
LQIHRNGPENATKGLIVRKVDRTFTKIVLVALTNKMGIEDEIEKSRPRGDWKLPKGKDEFVNHGGIVESGIGERDCGGIARGTHAGHFSERSDRAWSGPSGVLGCTERLRRMHITHGNSLSV